MNCPSSRIIKVSDPNREDLGNQAEIEQYCNAIESKLHPAIASGLLIDIQIVGTQSLDDDNISIGK